MNTKPTYEELELENQKLKNLIFNMQASVPSEISDKNNSDYERQINTLKDNFFERTNITQAILDGIPIPVFFKDTEGKYVGCNKTFCKIFGIVRNEIIGKTIIEVSSHQSAHEFHRIDMEHMNSKEKFISSFEISDKTGKKRDVMFFKDSLVDDNNQVIGMVGAYIDISEQKKIERELIISKEKAEQSDRLKSAFLANMSHEIRTPMNGIIGFADMLLSPDITQKEKENYISIIQSNGTLLLGIINDIIDISKIEAGETEVHNHVFSLNNLLEEIEHNFTNQAKERSINLVSFMELPTDKSLIFSDELKIRQILMNLISNSLKFTKKGYIHFGYKTRNADVEFFVKDTGTGIDKDTQKVIFNRFRQGIFHKSNIMNGTGLGLAISKAYAELLGGHISVDSEVGVGTVFKVTIPFQAVYQDKVSEKQDIELDLKDLWKNKNILIVEDEEINRLYLHKLLQKTQVKIFSVSNGIEAVDYIKEHNDIDLVLMDIKLPKKNGFDATKEIKEINSKLPVIAQTAYAFEEDRVKAIEAGCDSFISKPIRKTELYNLIDTYLNK